jgi:N-6 DNA Methylase
LTPVRLPSLDVPEPEKQRYSEAEVHSTLFEPDMRALGYPPRESSQASGEYFTEQRRLALRRLRSGRDTGRFDGLYLVGNSPIVLCEVKRYGELDSEAQLRRAVAQVQDYARSEDFAAPPPFLVLYCGRPDRTRFFRLRTVADGSLLDDVEYELLGSEIWTWERVKSYHLKGAFAEEVVDRERLREILLFHLGRIEESIQAQVTQAIQVVTSDGSPMLVGEFGRWLEGLPEARRRLRALYDRKVAETGKTKSEQVVPEMVTQAALNYLNKVFFLNLCEDRHLPGFYRIMREFLPRSRAETTPAQVAVFLGLLRRRIRDASAAWDPEEEVAYRRLRTELAPDIRDRVIGQNSWRDLMQVAFDLAAESFPLVFREEAYDYFRPDKDVLAEFIYDLSTKSFRGLTNQSVGDIYQSLLSARRTQQAKLGAFYTPAADVRYMVSKLGLTADSKVLDPCMGSGHFLEGIHAVLLERYAERGVGREEAHEEIVAHRLYGGDIDPFALSLAAIRLFLLGPELTGTQPNLFVHDMLLHSPERNGVLFSDAERVAGSIDPEVDDAGPVDAILFDAVVGNPPYGARKPENKQKAYARLYGTRPGDVGAGSIGTGDGDTYAMFFANGIERLREGGRMSLITNDSFRTLTTHAALRRRILDTCKVVEILLTDTRHFDGVSFQFAGMAITTLEKCSDAAARRAHRMRLVDTIRDPKRFATPPADRVFELNQGDYEALPETPFFVGVPREVFEAARDSLRLRDVAQGRQGLATADDRTFLAAADDERVIQDGIASSLTDIEKREGTALQAHWVPFAKGEGFGEYWRRPGFYIDWSREAVAELNRRASLPSGTPRKTYFRNRDRYFRSGLTYSVISSGRVSVRLMPEGWIFGHKGSAIFVTADDVSELFLLGYLNSSLATFFMKKLVNATATADVGYVEKLPYRKPPAEIESAVVGRVETIVAALQSDPAADVTTLRDEIDDLVFDLFEIRSSRDLIRRFYREVGRVPVRGAQATE